mmetsp:Transcript_23872/g.21213  ORF Transcript_23872/g.21213 Transcript_23872/m.21213 type:complete len:142 (+) Transcript_23872:921-1346(+)
MNYFYDSYAPKDYQQFLMPYVLYSRRLDIDGASARDLFHNITLIDERMRLVFIISLIIGGILTSGGASLLALTCFRNRQRSKLLKELNAEEKQRSQSKLLKKSMAESTDTDGDHQINGNHYNNDEMNMNGNVNINSSNGMN